MSSDEQKLSDLVDGIPVHMEVAIAMPYPSGPALYANHFACQFDGDDFHLSFYEIQPPLIVGTPEEKKKAVDTLKALPARPVARIVISKGRIPTVVKNLIESIKGGLGEDALK